MFQIPIKLFEFINFNFEYSRDFEYSFALCVASTNPSLQKGAGSAQTQGPITQRPNPAFPAMSFSSVLQQLCASSSSLLLPSASCYARERPGSAESGHTTRHHTTHPAHAHHPRRFTLYYRLPNFNFNLFSKCPPIHAPIPRPIYKATRRLKFLGDRPVDMLLREGVVGCNRRQSSARFTPRG